MKKRIVAFGASNSKHSINKNLAEYVANCIEGADVDLLDLNDFEMPIYSIDRQQQIGVPDLALKFLDKIKQADGIVISFAEHNGAYSVAFKNIFDWASRSVKNVWMNKPMFVLATSTGPGGAGIVLDIAVKKFSYMSSNLVIALSVPNYGVSFTPKNGFENKELAEKFNTKLNEFISTI